MFDDTLPPSISTLFTAAKPHQTIIDRGFVDCNNHPPTTIIFGGHRPVNLILLIAWSETSRPERYADCSSVTSSTSLGIVIERNGTRCSSKFALCPPYAYKRPSSTWNTQHTEQCRTDLVRGGTEPESLKCANKPTTG